MPRPWLRRPVRFGRRAAAVRQQVVDLRGGVIADAREHVLDVRERVDPVRLARGDERIEAGELGAGNVVADEEKILPIMQSTP